MFKAPIIPKKEHGFLYEFFDALSLSGAMIFIFFVLTLTGIMMNNEKIWQNFGTALATFATAKKISDGEHQIMIDSSKKEINIEHQENDKKEESNNAQQ